MSMQDQIKTAVGVHGMWKARLKSAIDKSSSEFTASTVRRDDACEFGKWLKSGVDPAERRSPGYQKCTDLHRQFHEKAAVVLELALAGKTDQAKQAIGPTGAVTI